MWPGQQSYRRSPRRVIILSRVTAAVVPSSCRMSMAGAQGARGWPGSTGSEALFAELVRDVGDPSVFFGAPGGTAPKGLCAAAVLSGQVVAGAASPGVGALASVAGAGGQEHAHEVTPFRAGESEILAAGERAVGSGVTASGRRLCPGAGRRQLEEWATRAARNPETASEGVRTPNSWTQATPSVGWTRICQTMLRCQAEESSGSQPT